MLMMIWLKSPTNYFPGVGMSNSADEKVGNAGKGQHRPQTLQGGEETRLKKLGDLISVANAPVEFYGKVVDQDGSPISDVCVDWRVGKAGYFSEQPKTKGKSYTNSNGVFSILNERGRALSIKSMEKDGYRESNGGYISFGYGGNSSYVPDINNPVVYLMVKNDIPKSKILGEQKINLVWNAEINLIKLGEENIELLISPTRDWKRGQRDGYTWNLDVSIAGGGIIDAGTVLLAPLNGYADHVSFGFRANQAGWQAGVDRNFVYKTKEGKYGILKLNLYTDRESDSRSLYIESAINISGNRNL